MNNNNDIIYDYKLNLLGIRCPDTILSVRKLVRDIQNSQTILIVSDDSTTIQDIPRFCRFMGHKLLLQNINFIPYTYLIQKSTNTYIKN